MYGMSASPVNYKAYGQWRRQEMEEGHLGDRKDSGIEPGREIGLGRCEETDT